MTPLQRDVICLFANICLLFIMLFNCTLTLNKIIKFVLELPSLVQTSVRVFLFGVISMNWIDSFVVTCTPVYPSLRDLIYLFLGVPRKRNLCIGIMSA